MVNEPLGSDIARVAAERFANLPGGAPKQQATADPPGGEPSHTLTTRPFDTIRW
jgi:hypothetical protein